MNADGLPDGSPIPRPARPRRRTDSRRRALECAADQPLGLLRAGQGRLAVGRRRQRLRGLSARPGSQLPRSCARRRDRPPSTRRCAAAACSERSTRWRTRPPSSSWTALGWADQVRFWRLRHRSRTRPRCGWPGPPPAATKFIRFEGHYHGWLDNVLIGPCDGVDRAGQRRASWRITWTTRSSSAWNDADALTATLRGARGRDRRGDHGADDVQHRRHRSPTPAIWSGSGDCASDHGVVLIFDEVITGFRLALGGAASGLGVTPDLADLRQGDGRRLAGRGPGRPGRADGPVRHRRGQPFRHVQLLGPVLRGGDRDDHGAAAGSPVQKDRRARHAG